MSCVKYHQRSNFRRQVIKNSIANLSYLYVNALPELTRVCVATNLFSTQGPNKNTKRGFTFYCSMLFVDMQRAMFANLCECGQKIYGAGYVVLIYEMNLLRV